MLIVDGDLGLSNVHIMLGITPAKNLYHFFMGEAPIEEVRYGMLMMVLCDWEGRVYDVWITLGSVHEVRAFRERKRRSLWFRKLVESCVVYGDR